MDSQSQPTQVSGSAAPAPVAPSAPVQTPPPSSVPTQPPPPSMPTPKASHKKLIVGLLLIFILLSVGLGLYTLYMTKSSQVMYQDASKTRPQATATPTEIPVVEGVKSGDAQLDQQSVKIDAGLDSLNTDITNVDKGLKDQPDNLSQ